MGIIRKTFTFWLIAGLITALVATLIVPRFKTKVIEKIPGRNEVLNIVKRAKAAIKKLPKAKQVVQQKIEEIKINEPVPQLIQDSAKNRDDKLFKRQCAILDDLL